MKSMTPALQNLLDGKAHFFECNLFTWTLVDGTVIRSTDADIDLTLDQSVHLIPGHAADVTFLSDAPPMKRSKVTNSVGIEIDEISVDILDPGFLLNDKKLSVAAREGDLDGSSLLVQKAYLVEWPQVVGIIHVFYGFMAEVNPGRREVSFRVKSLLDYLSGPFPGNVYQATCLRTLYDSGCGVNREDFTFEGQITSASFVIAGTNIIKPNFFFDMGVLEFMSGEMTGLKRTIKSYHGGGAITVANPFPLMPQVGDTVRATAGCQRTRAVCLEKFDNLIHFRGFPFIPVPETTY